MTENLAGRGEGLAGLADRISERVAALLDPEQLATLGKGGRVPSSTLRYNVRKAKLGVAEIVKEELAALEAAAPAGTAKELAFKIAHGHYGNVGCSSALCRNCEYGDPNGFTCRVCELQELAESVLTAALATPSPQAPQCCCNVSWLDLDQRDCPIHGPAATQEQPAGSAPQWNVEQILVYIWQCIGGEDSDPKEYPYSQFAESEGGKMLRSQMKGLGGSPRKVGEDGLTEDEQATVAMLERWRDKGTMLTNAELLVLKLARSVPVGEQKQEEGV